VPPAHTPMNLAIIVCDSIIDDRETGKKTLVGIFNRLGAVQFPCQHPSLAVFVSLTEGQGPYNAQLQCLKANEDKPILQLEGRVEFKDPKAVVELGFTIGGMIFPQPGIYEFQFLCDGVPLGPRRPFEVFDARRKDDGSAARG
jgi:hypothetical protein